MRPFLLSLVLCGCGPALVESVGADTPVTSAGGDTALHDGTACGPVFVEPVGADSPVTSAGGDLPVACVDRCIRVTEQLVNDFGIPRERIQCGAQFGGALTCAVCQQRFESTFSVRLTSCP